MFRFGIGNVAFLVCLFAPQISFGSTSAKMVSLNVNRSQAGINIDMLFDKPVAAKNLKPTYERNFVQVVLKSTKMDSAKMLSVPETTGEIQKVFAYPYSPDLARLRIILKGDSSWAKGKVSVWNNNPKSIRLFVRSPRTVQATEVSAVAKEPNRAPAIVPSTEESALIKEVISNTNEIDINNPDSVKAAVSKAEDSIIKEKEKEEEVGIKADPSRHFARMAISLFGILALFVGGAVLFKKYASKLKSLPFGKKERLIQVVATHYLGNKKSISLVKITGEYMVVGVSNEGISLISKLGPEVNVDRYLEDRFWGGTFEKHLDSYAGDAKVAKEVDLQDEVISKTESEQTLKPALNKYDGVRDLAQFEVTDKVELSPLRASIKEKLTRLKPLA